MRKPKIIFSGKFKQLNIIILLLTSFIASEMNAQVWTIDNPFRTDVFIKNAGQFNYSAKTAEPVKYVVCSDNVFFTQHGLTYKLQKESSMTEEVKEKLEEKDNNASEEVQVNNTFYVNMHWEGCNPNAVLQVEEESAGYYTFGAKGFESLKAKGYKKLIYKELYPGIDVEYTIPVKGGIEYRLILHQGADADNVKMKYSGDFNEIKKDVSGNILITTYAGDIIDHAPHSFLQSNFKYQLSTIKDQQFIESSFILNKNIVQFQLLSTKHYALSTDLIIDPWTIIPSNLGATRAYDIDYDNQGNVYVSGGLEPFYIVKYSKSGAYLWTFALPNTWAFDGANNEYSKFSVIRNSGSIFIGEAHNTNGGPRVMKISTAGILQITSNNISGTDEIWIMMYNYCTGNLKGLGGGVSSMNNLQIISDTMLTSSVASAFNGSVNIRNDVASVVQDVNGDFYAFITSLPGVNPFNDHIQKCLAANNFAPPLGFDVLSHYNFNEYTNSGITGFTPSHVTTRANILALNSSYLFSYDGKTLIAWNKTNGSKLDTIVVSSIYNGGQARTHEGISVDECNDIYVAGNDTVHVFSFNGTNLIRGNPITNNINGEVYDITIDDLSNILYVSGNNFVTVAQGLVCKSEQLNITSKIDTCNGIIKITPANGTPPYQYAWNTGSTVDSIIVKAGTYTVTVTDASCVQLMAIDTFKIHDDSISVHFAVTPSFSKICPGDSVTLIAAATNFFLPPPPFTFTWSPANGLSDSTGSKVYARPADTTIYTIKGYIGINCFNKTSDTIIVFPKLNINVNPSNPTICRGDSVTLTANAVATTTFTWSPPAGLNVLTGSTVIAKPANSTSYKISGIAYGCKDSINVNVNVNPLPVIKINPIKAEICKDSTLTIKATGAKSYLWSPATGLDTTADSIVSAKPRVQITYVVSGTDTNGCVIKDSVTIKIYPNTLTITPNPIEICAGDSIQLTANGGVSTYSWSPSTGLDTIKGQRVYLITYPVNPNNPPNPPGPGNSYTVTSIDSSGCRDSTTANVTINHVHAFTLGRNDTICPGTSVTLNPDYNGTATYMWNNNSTNSTLTVNQQGKYSVTLTDSNACKGYDSVSVFLYPQSTINLGKDTTISTGTTIVLNAGSGFTDYLWQDGSHNSTFTVDQKGKYWVSATDKWGCVYSDTIIINDTCIGEIFVPNAFTPNSDMVNDYFMPVGNCIEDFNMIIFNRLGEAIFETNEVNKGWDGTYKNIKAPEGVYLYVISYHFIGVYNKINKIKTGIITLLR